MRKVIKCLLLTAAMLSASAAVSAAPAKRLHRAAAAKCTGAASCRACKNCRYCQHCAKNGGTCGVCRRRGSELWQAAASRAGGPAAHHGH